MKKYTFHIILFFLFCIRSAAQNPVYRNITNLNGLPSNTVYNLLQDNKGYIWIAHDRGLSRYDGKQFKQYNTNSQQGKSLSNLMEAGGTVWCQDFSGNYFYVQGDSLARERNLYTPGNFASAQQINKNIFASCKGDSIRTLNAANRKYHAIPFPGDFIPAVCAADNGLYFLTTNSLQFFNDSTVERKQVFSAPMPNFFFLLKTSGGVSAFTRNTYPYIHTLANNQVKPLPLLQPGLFIQDINVIDDEVWISTSTGAWCFTPDWKPKYNGRCFYPGNSITKVLKDREGSYWFGSLNNGVLIVANINTLIYPHNNEAITTLGYNNRLQSVIAGTSANRLLQFNENQNNFKEIFKGPGTQELLHIFNDDITGNMIISSDKTRLLTAGNVWEHSLSGIKSVCLFNKDFYAVAISGGYGLLPVKAMGNPVPPGWLTISKSKSGPGLLRINEKELRGRWVCMNAADSTLYAATTDGLFYYTPQANGKVLFGSKDIFPSQVIIAEGSIFAGTYNNGLFKIERDKATPLLGANKTIAKTIYRLFKNGDWVWAASDDKLQKINITTKKVIEYTYADGLPRAELKDVQVHNGKVFLATTNGLVVFADDAESENKTPPLLELNNLLVNNKPVNYKPGQRFAAAENNMAINFSLLAYKGEDVHTVQYKINNGEWIMLEPGARAINLSAMAAGNYSIAIQAFNEDGIASQKNIDISFSIARPFYKSLWFIGGLLLLTTGLIYIYFRHRLRVEKKNTELLSEKIKLEQELHQSVLSSIKSQMNPHFLFNALNTIQSYIYTNEKENASLYLGKFSELTRMILDMSNKEAVSLADEIKALSLYLELESLRFEDKLNYTIETDEAISPETAYIPSMLIQPYVENAIKHGLLHSKNKWQLTISFHKKETGIEVVVDDNGIGRKRSEEINSTKGKSHKSFAVSANQRRLDILNKGLGKNISVEITDKTDTDGNASGTKVVLHVPFVKTKN